MKRLILLGIFLMTVSVQAQVSWEGSYNRLGIKAGANRFAIISNQLELSPKVSWTAGFTTRSSFYERFQFIYGISFYDFKSSVSGREKVADVEKSEEIPFNMIGVQGNFLGSYKILGHRLSVEAGPVIQINGKLDARQDKELFYVQDYDFQAVDMEKISPFSVNLAFGVSGGFETLKFWAVYQYGLNNIFSRLNNGEITQADPSVPEFQGHLSLISGGIVIFL